MLHPSPHNPAPRGVWVAPVWAQSISLWSSKSAQCSPLPPCQVREQAAACSEGGARQIPSQRWQRAHPSTQSLQGGAPYMDLCLLWAGDYCDKGTGCVQGLLPPWRFWKKEVQGSFQGPTLPILQILVSPGLQYVHTLLHIQIYYLFSTLTSYHIFLEPTDVHTGMHLANRYECRNTSCQLVCVGKHIAIKCIWECITPTDMMPADECRNAYHQQMCVQKCIPPTDVYRNKSHKQMCVVTHLTNRCMWEHISPTNRCMWERILPIFASKKVK